MTAVNSQITDAVAPASVSADESQELPALPAGSGSQSSPQADKSPAKPAGTYVPIQEKYCSIDTSGLSYTVKKGDQTHDIPVD